MKHGTGSKNPANQAIISRPSRNSLHFREEENHIASPTVQLKKQNNPMAQTSKDFLILLSDSALIAIAGNANHDPTEMGHDEADNDASPFSSLDHSIVIV